MLSKEESKGDEQLREIEVSLEALTRLLERLVVSPADAPPPDLAGTYNVHHKGVRHWRGV